MANKIKNSLQSTAIHVHLYYSLFALLVNEIPFAYFQQKRSLEFIAARHTATQKRFPKKIN